MFSGIKERSAHSDSWNLLEILVFLLHRGYAYDSGESRTWTVVLRNPNSLKNANGWISTADGDSGSIRYVIDIEKSSASYWHCLLIREGGVGRIRFDHVRIERI